MQRKGDNKVFPWGFIEIREYEPIERFPEVPRTLDRNRIWMLTNLVHAMNELLAGTGVAEVRLIAEPDKGRFVIVLRDKHGLPIYYDFVDERFPARRLLEARVPGDKVRELEARWSRLTSAARARRHTVFVQPIMPIRAEDVELIMRVLRERFPNFVIGIGRPLRPPARCFDKLRRQYRADLLLNILRELRGRWELIVGVTDADVYVPGLNYVFSLQDKPVHTTAAIFSLYRLRRDLVGSAEDRKVFESRVRKQLVHIIGHFLGLPDCPRPHCVMSYVDSVVDVDIKTEDFCPRCLGMLVPGRVLLGGAGGAPRPNA